MVTRSVGHIFAKLSVGRPTCTAPYLSHRSAEVSILQPGVDTERQLTSLQREQETRGKSKQRRPEHEKGETGVRVC